MYMKRTLVEVVVELNKRWKLIFIVVIGVVLIGGGLFLLMTKQHSEQRIGAKQHQVDIASDMEKVQLLPEKGYDGFEGWGTSLAWWGHAIGGWENKQATEEIMDLVFDRDKGLGLNIVRYNIGGGENPDYHTLRPGGDVPGFWPEPDVWDWAADANQRAVLLGGIQRGVNIAEAFSNSPPYWMTISGSVTGAEDGGNNLQEEHYETFAHYLTEVVKHYQEEWNVVFRSLNPLNEPSSNWWKKGNIQEGTHFDIDKQAYMLQLTAKILAEKGLTDTIVSGPDDNSIDETLEALEKYGEETLSILGQVNVHTYNGSKMQELKQYADDHSLRLWMSEYGTGGAGGHNHDDMTSVMELAERIMFDLRLLQPKAWVYWQAVEDEGANNNWGFIHANFNGEERYFMNKQFYAMRQFTRFIEPGAFIAPTSDGYSIYAYNEESKQLTIVVRNPSDTERNLYYDLAPYKAEAQTAKVYRTSANENFVGLPSLEFDGQGVSVPVSATSITTIVIENVTYGEIE